MRVLVFGGCGFVGLNIVETLLTRGHDVLVLDASVMPVAAGEYLDALPGSLEVVRGDVREAAEVASACADRTHIVYGAAITAAEAREKATPEAILEVNLMGLVHALRAAQAGGVRRVLNLSSASAYGEVAYGPSPLREDMLVDPKALYGFTKLGTECVGARLAELWQLDFVSVRLTAVFGRWERQTSVRDTPSPLLQLMQAWARGTPALLSRPGHRDWTYAPDIAEAVVRVLEAEHLSHRLYNISTGSSWSVLKFGNALAERRPGFECRLAGPDENATIDVGGSRDRASLDITRLREAVGFEPRFGMLDALDDYITWSNAHGVPMPLVRAG